MKYDGETYYAKAVLADNGTDCYFQVLDEDGSPFVEAGTGRILGVYDNASTAGVDVINFRREKKGVQNRVRTLRGNIYWVNEAGLSIRDLIEKY